MITRKILAVAMTAACSTPALAADAPDPANAGKAFFRAQCSLCHSAEPNDNGGAQGPSLQGVFGSEAASGDFSYTDALKNSNLSWDAATLDRFLANPVAVVPGSAMVVPVPGNADRANVIAYFEALDKGTFKEPERPAFGGGGGFGGPPPAATPPAGDPEWKKDAPGVVHKVDVANLPAPYATSSANNFPRLVEKPAGAELKLPEGFEVDVFATGLQAPRAMVIAPNGDVFLAETQSGRIKVLRPSADGSRAQEITIFAQGLLQPLGIAFQPAENPEWVYIAETNRVVRYPYKNGDTVASTVPEVIIPQLSPVGGGHYTRDIAFSPDGESMFVSVGSQSNVAEGLMEPKSAAEIQAWDAQHGLGATWGQEENRAMVRVYEVGSSDTAGETYATGIRNCVGLTVQPANGELWCTTNERDMLGDDLVPDYSTRVKEGGFYGWPWYYMGKYEDPRHAGARPDLAGKAIVPDVPYTAHSASVDLEFYPENPSGSSAFPAEYAGEGFAVLHGSWNRGHRTGHKIVRLPMNDGVPTGEYIDFMTGFITEDGNSWGRPVAIVVAQDGSLLLSDDGANIVYRISYTK
jgi:glucose/arabinose dehydrogenase/cytochrome c2